MPFTLAHPSLIIPLRSSRFFSYTALIVGSVVPDFEFFLQLREANHISHQGWGILLFDLPLGFIICYLYHMLVKPSLMKHLPDFAGRRISYTQAFNWHTYTLKNFAKIIFSLLIGTASHMFLDSFTHADGFFVEANSFFSAQVAIANFQIPIYYLLQILFSIFGIALILQQFVQLPTTNKNNYHQETALSYWFLFLFSFFMILYIRIFLWPMYNGFWSICMAIIGSGIYSLIFVSLLFYYIFKK